jgi:hypothetical protein
MNKTGKLLKMVFVLYSELCQANMPISIGMLRNWAELTIEGVFSILPAGIFFMSLLISWLSFDFWLKMMHISTPVGVYYIGLYVYPLVHLVACDLAEDSFEANIRNCPSIFFIEIMAFSKADSWASHTYSISFHADTNMGIMILQDSLKEQMKLLALMHRHA